MENSRLFNRTYKFLGKALDISSFRHSLITGNIANMDTIGYKPKDLNFQRTLQKEMQGKQPNELSLTNKKHFSDFETTHKIKGSEYDNSDVFHLDTVDIDEQMSNLAENNIKYRESAELMIRKMKILQYSIDEGGR